MEGCEGIMDDTVLVMSDVKGRVEIKALIHGNQLKALVYATMAGVYSQMGDTGIALNLLKDAAACVEVTGE